MIILNSPGNPTGGVLPAQDLEHIAAAALKHDAWVLSDEIYSQIVFDGSSAASIAPLDGLLERTVVLDGFSKTYAMTGWRLGYAIMPEALAGRVSLVLNHSVGCTAHFTQLAAIEALTGPQQLVADMVAEYQLRRDLLIPSSWGWALPSGSASRGAPVAASKCVFLPPATTLATMFGASNCSGRSHGM